MFTEDNPGRELLVAAHLAAASRALRGFNDGLAQDCLDIARKLWGGTKESNPLQRVNAAVELFLTTKDRKYADFLVSHGGAISRGVAGEADGGGNEEFAPVAWLAARSLAFVDDAGYRRQIRDALKVYSEGVARQALKTPYGVPYEPDVRGAGWEIQHFGMEQYYLHAACPDIFSAKPLFDAMNFMLGCHPGANTASFVSGVGGRSVTVAYGFNRADWNTFPAGSFRAPP